VKHPHKYKATPLSRIYLPKPKGGLRPLSIPTYVDRAIQTLYKFVLEPFHEETADTHSFGFRPLRSPGWAVKDILLTFWRSPPELVISIDIKKCFDNISHNFILSNVTYFKLPSNPEISMQLIPNPIITSWLTSGYVDLKGQKNEPHKIMPTIIGVPQGGTISPLISNMVFNGLESALKDEIRKPYTRNLKTTEFLNIEDKFIWNINGKPVHCTINCKHVRHITEQLQLAKVLPTPVERKPKIGDLLRKVVKTAYGLSYTKHSGKKNQCEITYEEKQSNIISTIRFADDIILLLNKTKKKNESMERLKNFLHTRGLEINLEKTTYHSIEQGQLRFSYLGFDFIHNVRHGKFKTYYYPSTDKVKAFILKLKTTFKESSKNTTITFLNINSILRGWCNYYRTSNASIHFNYLKYITFHLCLKYLVRVHETNKQFRLQKKKIDRYKLYQFIFETYLKRRIKHKKEKWFIIPPELSRGKNRLSNTPLSLVYPIPMISHPMIITGKSSCHPTDRKQLEAKALEWQWGLKKRLLKKSKMICACCQESIMDSEPTEIHHIMPIKYGGDNTDKNLLILHKYCHQLITTDINKAIRTKDYTYIHDVITVGLFSLPPEYINQFNNIIKSVYSL
jgi:retron-type reverse transcriptase